MATAFGKIDEYQTGQDWAEYVERLEFYFIAKGCFRNYPRGGGPQTLFCPVGGGCFVDNVSEGWGVEGELVLGVKAYLIHSGAG